MNSLFQDGATVGWMFGESFIMDHARRSVIPERLSRCLMERDEEVMSQDEFDTFKYMTDAYMTDQEIAELPKAWGIGGDGGMGDIGYQNVSKVVLQNRPNVKLLMLDTQVYSNTGGQNSDSTPMLGGGDMNSFGTFSQGKLTEKKNVAETFISGHGSPYVAQVSMANSARLFKSILDALAYRGTSFLQCFTTCQPEHGVADDVATIQASRVRDSRSMPEFVFDPTQGETYTEALLLKGNPNPERDWGEVRSKARGGRYRYLVAHWAATEARFRKHVKAIPESSAAEFIHIDNMLTCITQQDVTYRRMFDESQLAYVPDFGVYFKAEVSGKFKYFTVSRQMILFAVERRKAWRMLQSKAGVENKDYTAQKALLAKVEKGELTRDDLLNRGSELLNEEVAAVA